MGYMEKTWLCITPDRMVLIDAPTEADAYQILADEIAVPRAEVIIGHPPTSLGLGARILVSV